MAAGIRPQDRVLRSSEPPSAAQRARKVAHHAPDYRHLGYRFGANLVQTVVKKGKVYTVQAQLPAG